MAAQKKRSVAALFRLAPHPRLGAEGRTRWGVSLLTPRSDEEAIVNVRAEVDGYEEDGESLQVLREPALALPHLGEVTHFERGGDLLLRGARRKHASS